jgi:hypothetical protein
VAIKMIADGVFTTITPANFRLAMGSVHFLVAADDGANKI